MAVRMRGVDFVNGFYCLRLGNGSMGRCAFAQLHHFDMAPLWPEVSGRFRFYFVLANI